MEKRAVPGVNGDLVEADVEYPEEWVEGRLRGNLSFDSN
jgi:hypothetical protein